MKPATRSFYQAAVERAVHRVIRTLDGALDLASLASEAALSPFHFHRVFRGMIGETPLELHRRLRLETFDPQRVLGLLLSWAGDQIRLSDLHVVPGSLEQAFLEIASSTNPQTESELIA